MFENVQQGPVDPMFVLKRDADSDASPDKVDLGVGIYRNTEGKYHKMGVLREVSMSVQLQEFDADTVVSQIRLKESWSKTTPDMMYKLLD